jgi:serine/threonine-protein kinase
LPITCAQLVERLGLSGLLPAGEVETLQKSLSAEQSAQPAPTLASDLVRQQKLTQFQADALSADVQLKLVYGEYTVLEKIGEGGMGVVYKAQNRRLKRIVALKALHPHITKNEEAVRRFKREVEVSSRLSHPNIVTAYDYNQEDGVHYLVMDYVDGVDLFRLVKTQGPQSADRALDYLLQAARGLEHAHERGVIHRDIKPSNLLVDREGTVRVLDLGLVRVVDPDKSDGNSTDSGHLTQTGEILGSFDYMAPEQAIDTKRVDHRADIYSLGCTLYFLLSGRSPFRGETSMQKLLAHRESAIPSLRQLPTPIPLALDSVFHRMLAKKAEDRYPSMLELTRDLEACRQAPKSPAADHKPENHGASRLVSSHLIVCGTICILAVIASNAFITHQAVSNQWKFSDEILFVKWYALFAGISVFAGIGMIVIGTLMSMIASVGERLLPATSSERSVRLRPRRAARAAGRWLLGALAGIILGGIVGAVVGVGLATHNREIVRIVGGVIIGAVVGAALFGWRSWVLTLGCAVAGFFVGSTIGEHGLSLVRYGVDYQLQSDDLAMFGFGIVGAIVGAVLGTRMSTRAKPATSTVPSEKTPHVFVDDPSDRALASHETVRRAPRQ